MTRSDETALELNALRALASFGLQMFDAHRALLGHIDGGDCQALAEACGLLAHVQVDTACGDLCRCVEDGDFPQLCLRPTAALHAGRAALSTTNSAPTSSTSVVESLEAAG